MGGRTLRSCCGRDEQTIALSLSGAVGA